MTLIQHCSLELGYVQCWPFDFLGVLHVFVQMTLIQHQISLGWSQKSRTEDVAMRY